MAVGGIWSMWRWWRKSLTSKSQDREQKSEVTVLRSLRKRYSALKVKLIVFVLVLNLSPSSLSNTPPQWPVIFNFSKVVLHCLSILKVFRHFCGRKNFHYYFLNYVWNFFRLLTLTFAGFIYTTVQSLILLGCVVEEPRFGTDTYTHRDKFSIMYKIKGAAMAQWLRQ